MKRILCAVLLILLLCPLLLQTGMASEDAITPEKAPDMTKVPSQVLDRGLNSRKADRTSLFIEEGETSGQFADRPATRAAQNNLLVPSPLMYGQASTPGTYQMDLHCIAYEYGRSDQSYAVMVYKGTNLNKDPIATVIGSFSTATGMREVTVVWRYDNDLALGTYTVVTCTATGSGGNYQSVSGTAYAETVYIVPAGQAQYVLKSVWFEDVETGKWVDTLKLGIGETRVLKAHRVPEITYDYDPLHLGHANELTVENYNGLYLIGAKDYCGWFSCSGITMDYLPYSLNGVEVCWEPGGHRDVQTTHLRNAEQTVAGADMEYCPVCGAARIIKSDNLETAFTRFTDLNKSAWYYDAVKAAVYAGLFSGVSTTKFDPNAAMTRAMLVCVLWSYAGKPACTTAPFTDVPAGQWFTTAVNWAAENRIVSGTGEGKFSPNGVVTREQVAVILQRFAEFLGEETPKGEELSGFEDAEWVSEWALAAVRWAVSEGLISGVKDKELLYVQPQGSASRAQVATILTRFLEQFREPEPPAEEIDPEGAEAAETDWAFYPDGSLVVKGTRELFYYNINKYVFADAPWQEYADRITSVRITYGTTMLYNGCFHDLVNLQKVELPSSVKEIGKYAFTGCTSLKTVCLPEKLRILDNAAFADCTALEDIELPQTLQNIGEYCFQNCTSLRKIEIPDSVVHIPGIASGDRMTVEAYAFSGCTALEQIRLPAGMLELPTGLFENCTALKQLELPIGIQTIWADVLSGCNAERVIVPFSVSEIMDNAFRNINGLKEVWVLNPLAKCPTGWYTSEEKPVYNSIFGDPASVTVYAWAGSEIEAVAKSCGYAFVALDTLSEDDIP